MRTREGLTYGIFSAVIPGWIFPGTTIVQANTDPPHVSKVISLVIEEVRRLKEKGVTRQEISAAKRAMIARFAGIFENLHDALSATAFLEYRGRPLDFYVRYRERLASLKFKVINNAASNFLDPSELRILVAGNREKVKEAKPPLSRFGLVKEIPLRDPFK